MKFAHQQQHSQLSHVKRRGLLKSSESPAVTLFVLRRHHARRPPRDVPFFAEPYADERGGPLDEPMRGRVVGEVTI